jgi:Na+/H+ antiporter NhaD/arsenite permease-like protein
LALAAGAGHESINLTGHSIGYITLVVFVLAHALVAGRYDPEKSKEHLGDVVPFDIFRNIARAERDTLMFFYGAILCVGGLVFIGYLAMVSQVMYTDWGTTPANVMVGISSAIVDNIRAMFAVLTMYPDMSQGQWLLVTLTAGVGGQYAVHWLCCGRGPHGPGRGMYIFSSHLKWTPAIAGGYAAIIYVHFPVNRAMFWHIMMSRTDNKEN